MTTEDHAKLVLSFSQRGSLRHSKQKKKKKKKKNDRENYSSVGQVFLFSRAGSNADFHPSEYWEKLSWKSTMEAVS